MDEFLSLILNFFGALIRTIFIRKLSFNDALNAKRHQNVGVALLLFFVLILFYVLFISL